MLQDNIGYISIVNYHIIAALHESGCRVWLVEECLSTIALLGKLHKLHFVVTEWGFGKIKAIKKFVAKTSLFEHICFAIIMPCNSSPR